MSKIDIHKSDDRRLKYIYIPKAITIIVFSLLLFIATAFNCCIIPLDKSKINYGFDIISSFYMLLPVVYSAIFYMLFFYLLKEIEKIIITLSEEANQSLVVVTEVLEIVLVSVYSTYAQNLAYTGKVVSFLYNSVYFSGAVINNGLLFILKFWRFCFLIAPFVCVLIVFYSVFRLHKKEKKLRLFRQEIQRKQKEVERINQEKERINSLIGFDYETSDYYKQIKIPYNMLRQENGTYGEFEAYRNIYNGGLSDAKYVFNREIPQNDSLTTEIDLIVIHNKGIFVIENKHYTTKMMGKASDFNLRIITHYGQIKHIYNPIKQNEHHVSALKDYLVANGLYISNSLSPIFSIVSFTADRSDKSDDIISGIEQDSSSSTICTSQNLSYIINKIINDPKNIADIDVMSVDSLLQNLSIREKTKS